LTCGPLPIRHSLPRSLIDGDVFFKSTSNTDWPGGSRRRSGINFCTSFLRIRWNQGFLVHQEISNVKHHQTRCIYLYNYIYICYTFLYYTLLITLLYILCLILWQLTSAQIRFQLQKLLVNQSHHWAAQLACLVSKSLNLSMVPVTFLFEDCAIKKCWAKMCWKLGLQMSSDFPKISRQYSVCTLW
jgi:hypothetical protein